MLTDLLAFSPVPKLRRQFVFPILFAVTWFTFSYVYYAAGGLGLKVHDDEPPLDGEPYLYKVSINSRYVPISCSLLNFSQRWWTGKIMH